ncbi:hypothetical protein [uncultured Nocardioides sp.]|nr:hypothetical protein [uncultured Nocardioides sp.]
MAESFVLRSLERVVEIRMRGRAAALADRARQAWSRCLTDATPDGPPIEVRWRPRRPSSRSSTHVDAGTAGAVLELLSQAVALAGIEHGAGRLVMLHACGVADPDTGRTVVLAGPSGMGKSTAAVHLGRRWGYVSDETVAITEDQRVLPFPKPLSLIRGERWKEQVSPDDLGLVVPPQELRLGAIAILSRHPEGLTIVERKRRTEFVAQVAPHTSYLGELDRPVHRLAGLVEPEGGPILGYRSSDGLESLVHQLMEVPG